MVWNIPDEASRRKRDRWRVVVLWGLLGVMVVAALGAQWVITRAQQVELGPPVQVGPLSVRLPAGWEQTILRENPPAVMAMTEDGPDRPVRDVAVSVVPTEPWNSPTDYLRAEFHGEFLDGPRPITLAGRRGVMVTTAGQVVSGLGAGIPVYITTAAVLLDDETALEVQTKRWGEWDGGDAVLVQEVSESVQIDPGPAR